MDEDISKSNEAKIYIRTDMELTQIKNSKINEKKREIQFCKPLSPEDSVQGPDGKRKLLNSVKSEAQDDELMEDCANDLGGHLTFFKDGKPLLELSHRTEQGSWVQVKSKTYWPPATIAKTTTQLKNGSSLWSADECSNNSSAFTDHLRKQTTPKKSIAQPSCFFFHSVKASDHRRLKPRRSPFIVLYYDSCKDINYRKRSRSTLQEMLHSIYEKLGTKIERSLTISALYDTWKACDNESVVQSPRKRMMKHMNGEKDGNSRKKPYSCMIAASHKQSDRAAGSSVQINSKPATSSYSIDSILCNNSRRENESYLRNLLKSDVNESQSNVHNSGSQESAKSFKHKNWFESNNGSDGDGRGSKNAPPDYINLRKVPALNNFFLPYLNSGYLPMPPFYSGAQPTPEMASVVAAALQGMQTTQLLSSAASLEASYRAASLHSPQPRVLSHTSHSPQQRTLNRASPSSPQPRINNHRSQSPQSRATNRSSPHSPQARASSLASPQPRPPSLIPSHTISFSPNSKHNFNSHLANMSPYISSLNSPPSPWVPSTSNSSNVASSGVSPPPQDVPLNLSKRKEKG